MQESYCEYGILHVYMKHQVEALTLTLTGTSELEQSGLPMEELREMIKIMENLYIFGGTEQKSTTEARLVRQGSRRHDGTYLPIFDFRNVISAVGKELGAMKCGFCTELKIQHNSHYVNWNKNRFMGGIKQNICKG